MAKCRSSTLSAAGILKCVKSFLFVDWEGPVVHGFLPLSSCECIISLRIKNKLCILLFGYFSTMAKAIGTNCSVYMQRVAEVICRELQRQ